VGRQSVYRYDSGGMPAEWRQFKDSDECFQPNLLGMPRNALNTVYATSSSGSCQKRAVFRGSFDAKKMRWTPAYDVGTVAGGWMENFPGYGRGWGFGGPARGFAVHPSDPDIAALTNLRGVYVTLNGGKRWTQRDDTAARNRIGAVLVSVDSPRDRAGRTWTRMRTGPNHGILPPGPVVSVLYRAPHLYASVWGAGVFRSTPDAGGAGDWIRWGAPRNKSNKHFYQLHSDAGGNIYLAMAAERSSAPCASSTR